MLKNKEKKAIVVWNISRHNSIFKELLQGTVELERKRR